MFRRAMLGVVVLAMVAFAGASSADAWTCRGRSGFYGGGFYGGGYRAPVYRSARYYGGPSYYYGHPGVYRRAYYGAGPALYAAPRSGVAFSIGF